MFPHLLHKQNKNFSEDLDKVNEKVKGVGDEVLVSHPCLPDDQLGVEHDEAAEDRQAEPDVSLSHGLENCFSLSIHFSVLPGTGAAI